MSLAAPLDDDSPTENNTDGVFRRVVLDHIWVLGHVGQLTKAQRAAVFM